MINREQKRNMKPAVAFKMQVFERRVCEIITAHCLARLSALNKLVTA